MLLPPPRSPLFPYTTLFRSSIIRFVNQVLKDAIDLRASDIHLEPFEDELRIRYRIDGVLQDIPVPPQIKRFQPAIVDRKSTRLNSSHVEISYAVFCLKKKKK